MSVTDQVVEEGEVGGGRRRHLRVLLLKRLQRLHGLQVDSHVVRYGE